MSLSVLIFEISLMRVFSVLLRYHFVFLIVSMSMCGLGCGGILWAFIQKKLQSHVKPENMIFILSILTGILMPACIILLFKSPVKDFLTRYTVISFVPFLPFLLAGSFFSCVFQNYGSFSGRIYFADLAGAGIGCLLVLVLLKVGGINSCFGAGAICLFGAVIAVSGSKSIRKMLLSTMTLTVLLLLIIINHKGKYFDIPYVSAENGQLVKPLFTAIDQSNGSIVYTEWNAFARTDVVEFPRLADIKYIYTDGDVPTTMHLFDGKLSSVNYLKNTVFYLPFADLQNPKVLSIGPGGGIDILVSILGGSNDITGVEINPSMFSIMDKFAQFNGNLYKHHGVKIYLDDGRSFVKRTKERYDVIYLALTQSATGQNVGGVLTEGYIHTKEAFRDYLDKLNDTGMIVFVTQNELLLLRGFATFLQIFNNVHDPSALKRLMVFMCPQQMFETTPYRYVLIAGKKNFSSQRLIKTKNLAEKMGLVAVFVPGMAAKSPFDKFGDFVDVEKFVNTINSMLDQPVNLRPVSDDSPFFLDLTFGVPKQFQMLLLVIVIASIACMLNVILRNAQDIRNKNFTIPFFVFYFAIIGLGYMLVEIALIQEFILFLGHPTFAVSIVLFGLLASSGIGSYVSQFWGKNILKKVMITSIIIGATGFFYLVFLQNILDTCIEHARLLRVLISLTLILPAGFLMGILFPSGMKMITDYRKENIIPWLWAINGLMSVCGSIIAMMIAKTNGFSGAFLTGTFSYILIFPVCLILNSINYNFMDGGRK